jgi:hypothetical protein
MTHGLLPYVVEVAAGADAVTGRAGLPLVLEMMRVLGLDQVIAAHVRVRERASGATEVETGEALVLLLAAGGDCLDDIAVLQADSLAAPSGVHSPRVRCQRGPAGVGLGPRGSA